MSTLLNVMWYNTFELVPGKEQHFELKSIVVCGQREFYETSLILGNSG